MNLANSIFKRIYVDGPFTFDQLEERALKKGINIDDFYAAMEIVNKNRKLTISGKTYKRKVVKKPTFGSHLTWLRENYPPLIHGVNDASHPVFDGIDYSWLFMTPDEAKEYRVMLKGGYGGNSRRKNTSKNTQAPKRQGNLLLAKQQRGNLR